MIVADTNVIAYFYLPGEFAVAAESLRQRDPEWVAPPLWRSELRNALALYLRKGLLTIDKALEVQAAAESLMARNEFEVDSESVLRLAEQSGCAAYDCEFIALAQRLGVKLITADQKLVRRFPSVAVSLAAASSL